MRKFTFVVSLLILGFSSSAQLSFEGTSDFGKLWNITYDPAVANKLYALTLQNHIMVSVDNGVSWNIMYTFPSGVTHLSVLKMVPGGNALSFVASGNPDGQTNGLYVINIKTKLVKSHFIPPNWADNPAIVSYSIYNESAKNVLIHTSYSLEFAPFTKVYYTQNNGTQWTQVYFSLDNDNVQMNNVVISPGDSTKLFLARGLGSAGVNGGLFISTNAGNDWVEKLPGMALDPISFNPTDPNEFFIGTGISFGATPERLYHSVNGASSFDSISITWTDQTLNNITTLTYDPVDPTIVWMLEDNEIGKSVDGGHTWTMKAFSPDNIIYTYGTGITINPFNNNQLFITSDGYPQYSDNGGTTLMQAKSPFCVVNGVSYGNYTTSQDLFYSSQYGYFHKDLSTNTNTGYKTRSPFIVNLPSYTTFTDSTVPGRVFTFTPSDAFLNPSKLAYSDDRGATTISLPSDEYSTGLQFIEKDPLNPSQYWVSYSYYGSSSTLFKLNFSDPANAQATPVTLLESGLVTGLATSPVNVDILYLSQGVKIYKSVDGGLNWIEKTNGLEELVDGSDMIWDIKNNPINRKQFIVATSQGLYISDDSTEHWHMALAANNTRKVSFSPLVNGQIIAGIYTSLNTDCALVYSTNGGAAWQTITPSTLNYLPVYGADFKFFTDKIDTYFTTSDLGVVKYRLDNLPDPLPVRLFSFTASLKNNNAQLLWKTSNEENVKLYQVERSTNGINFEKTGSVAASNTAGSHTYNYEDQGFSLALGRSGVVYYRLKMIDVDGQFSYSPVVALTGRAGAGLNVSVYPNPVSSVLNLRMETTGPGQYVVKLIDAIGKEHLRKEYNLTTGNSAMSIPVNSLTPGMYTLVVVSDGKEMKHIKFMKN
ncbi:MAG: T9SS type A sorting domain-containing protein [Ferruginibacter sp.]